MRKWRLALSVAAMSAIVLTALTTSSAAPARPPESFTVNFDLAFTGPNSASGTFNITGALNDSGTASQVFNVVPPGGVPRTAHGIKTLEGANGSITIRFDAIVTPTSPTTAIAEGRFVVVSGTGAYEDLHATGTTFAALDFVAGTVSGSYEGFVYGR